MLQKCEKGTLRRRACVVAKSAKKGRRELMVAGALAFGETRRKKRLRDTEGF